MTRLRLLAIFLPVFLLASSAFAADDAKVAYVDLQRALNEVEEGAAAKSKLKTEFDEKQRLLDEKQNKLKALKEELDARQMMMKEDVKQQKMAELQQQLLEVQQTYFTMQQELTQKEGAVTGEIFKKMGIILQSMGREGEYDIIMEKSAALYAKPHLDLTNELIRRYNKAYGTQKGKGKKGKK